MKGVRVCLPFFLFAAIVAGGCSGGWAWPWSKKKVVTHPGIVSPAERLAALREMGDKAAGASADEQARALENLAQTLAREDDPLLRTEMVRVLGKYRGERSVAMLTAALRDADPEVRVAACEALARHRTAAAVPALTEVLGGDTDVDVRLAAAKALGETGDPTAVAGLGRALDDANPAMQYRAVLALRQVSGKDFGNDVDKWRQYVRGELPTKDETSIAERMRRLMY